MWAWCSSMFQATAAPGVRVSGVGVRVCLLGAVFRPPSVHTETNTSQPAHPSPPPQPQPAAAPHSLTHHVDGVLKHTWCSVTGVTGMTGVWVYWLVCCSCSGCQRCSIPQQPASHQHKASSRHSGLTPVAALKLNLAIHLSVTWCDVVPGGSGVWFAQCV
jgi:hypothetical protein